LHLRRSVAADGAENDTEDETDNQCEPEGEDCAGGFAGAGYGSRSGAALPGSPEPDLRLEESIAGQAARAFENGGGDGAADREREIEKLHAKIGQLIVERDLYERSSVKWRYIMQPPCSFCEAMDVIERLAGSLWGSMTVGPACARRINLYPAAP